MEYPIYTPDVSKYTTSLQTAIQDGWFSSQGEFLIKAREEASRILGSPYVVLVNNGTSATHLLYKALKFKYPLLRKIYVPDYVFVAVWNCALYEYSPDMLEVLPTDPVTFNPIYTDLEPNSAVVVVHNLGNVVNVPELLRQRPDLIIVEDCCEAFLEEYEGQKTGTAGLCAAVSFFGNKLVTTGEGGLWYTNNKELYDFIFKSCHHGMTDTRYVYDVLGYNYRMTNLQAALLYDQLCDIQTILDTKTRIRDRYRYLLPGLSVTTGRWMNVVRLPGTVYSEFAVKLRDYGIDTRPMFYNIHKHKHLQNIPAVSTPTNNDEVFMIPSSPGLSVYDQVFIATILRQIAAGNTPPKIHRITSKNISLLETFIGQGLPSTFRYFATRRADVCLQSHTLTLIATQKGNPIGYAHLDDRWIGLCILPEFQGNGLGSMLMDMILQFAHLSGISPLRLTVDKENERAFQMYKRRGFVVEQVKDTYFYMTNQNDSSSSLCGGSSG